MQAQRGNILFLILLAVVLFAALAYAVTSSMRGGGRDASSENAQVGAAAMLQFLSDMKVFMTRAQMVDNVKDDEFTFRVGASSGTISDYLFSNGGYNGWNYNGTCARAACRVFKPFNPDGIAAQFFEKYADPDYFTNNSNSISKGGHLKIVQLIVQNVGTPAPDLVAFIPGVRADVCNEVNKSVGLNTSYVTNESLAGIGETGATSRGANMSTSYHGAAVFDTTQTFGDEATQFAGRTTFCAPLGAPSAVGSKLVVVSVIIER